MSNTITIHHPVGQVAAVLTVMEFLLTAITAIALRAALRGLWLLSLHRTRRVSLSASARARRTTVVDALSFVMGVWLAVSVALVESNLSSGIRISNAAPKSGPHCLAMNSTVLPNSLIGSITPTLRAGVEPWALSVAMQVGCDALASVGTQVGTHIESGQKVEMAAPVCTDSVTLRKNRSGRKGKAWRLPAPPTEDNRQGRQPRRRRPSPVNGRPGQGEENDQDRPRPSRSFVRRQFDDDDNGVSVHIKVIKVAPRIMSVRPGISPFVEMWPLDARHIPARGANANLVPLDEDDESATRLSSWEVDGVCTRMGISSLRVSLSSGSWTGLFSDHTRTAFAVRELLCTAHAATYPNATGDRIVPLDRVVGIDTAMGCRHGDRNQDFEPTCLHQLARDVSSSPSSDGDDPSTSTDDGNSTSTTTNNNNNRTTLLFSTDVDRMWTFVLGLGANRPSYACANATVRVSYVLMSPEFILKFKSRAAEAAKRLGDPTFPEYPTLVPVHYDVVSGHCERVVHVLGRAALSYAADAHWRKTTLSSLSLVDTLHTFLIATASIQLPLTDLDVASTLPLREQWCLTREAIDVTEVAKDWRFWMLVSAVSMSCALAAVAAAFRGAFRGGAWTVGSAHWTLQMVENGQAQATALSPVHQHRGPGGAGAGGAGKEEEGAVHLEVVVKGKDVQNRMAQTAGVTKRKKGASAGGREDTATRRGSLHWWDMQELRRSMSTGGSAVVYELHTTAIGSASQQQGCGTGKGSQQRRSADVSDEDSDGS